MSTGPTPQQPFPRSTSPIAPGTGAVPVAVQTPVGSQHPFPRPSQQMGHGSQPVMPPGSQPMPILPLPGAPGSQPMTRPPGPGSQFMPPPPPGHGSGSLPPPGLPVGPGPFTPVPLAGTAIPPTAGPAPGASAKRELVPGMKLGPYQIVSHLATGGMAVIYKAFEPSLNRYVAIKVLRAELADEEAGLMFQQEAQAIAAIRHPNIVPIYYAGCEYGIAFFSMALIHGIDCFQLLAKHGRFEPARVLEIAKQAVGALAEAWRAKIIHRDIKPSNLMVEYDSQRVLLTDFGLARCLDAMADGPLLGEGWGSPGYISPEQINQEPTDFRSDIYSLGATLYHFLIGKTPYYSEQTQEEVFGHLEAPFPADQAIQMRIPPGWIRVLERMMAKLPADRFQSYEELEGGLDRIDEVTDYRPSGAVTVVPVAQRSEWRADLLNGLLKSGVQDWKRFAGEFQVELTAEKIMSMPLEPLDPWRRQIHELCRGTRPNMDLILEFADAVPEFAGYVVALADSGWYPPEDTLENLEDAVDAVGLNRCHTLALITIFLQESKGKGRVFNWFPLWQHGLSCGLLAERIVEIFEIRPTGHELAAGFFHDVGKVVFGEVAQMCFMNVLRRSFEERIELIHCEREAVNTDHTRLGRMWAEREGLPEFIIETIVHHHDPSGSRKYSSQIAAISLANHLCKRFGLGYSGSGVLDAPQIDDQPGLLLLAELDEDIEVSGARFFEEVVDRMAKFPLLEL